MIRLFIKIFFLEFLRRRFVGAYHRTKWLFFFNVNESPETSSLLLWSSAIKVATILEFNAFNHIMLGWGPSIKDVRIFLAVFDTPLPLKHSDVFYGWLLGGRVIFVIPYIVLWWFKLWQYGSLWEKIYQKHIFTKF